MSEDDMRCRNCGETWESWGKYGCPFCGSTKIASIYPEDENYEDTPEAEMDWEEED